MKDVLQQIPGPGGWGLYLALRMSTFHSGRLGVNHFIHHSWCLTELFKGQASQMSRGKGHPRNWTAVVRSQVSLGVTVNSWRDGFVTHLNPKSHKT